MITLSEITSFSISKESNRINQDSVLPPKFLDGGFLIAVADGVGSYKGGDLASKVAVEHLRDIKSKEEALNFEDVFTQIKKKVADLALKDESLSKAATTLTYAFIDCEGVSIGHIGDCRLYSSDGSRLKLLTKDHTQYQKLFDEGAFTKKFLNETKAKSILTTAIANNVEMQYESFFVPKEIIMNENGCFDMYLMSDGIHSFWDKRPRFSNGTMSSVIRFSNALKRRVERYSPIDDYSLVGCSINIR